MTTIKTTPSLEEIIELSGIHPLKVRNVYLYGSQVYGYANVNSDFDVMMVAPNMLVKDEIKDSKLNIHIITPDSFKEHLINNLKITYLECVFAPEWAKIKEKEKYDLNFSKNKIKKEILSQSYNGWRDAKFKMNKSDVYRGVKSAYHSLKTLYFGLQILEHGSIVDFSECNELHKDFYKEDFYEWEQIKEQYLELKIKLENKLKNYG